MSTDFFLKNFRSTGKIFCFLLGLLLFFDAGRAQVQWPVITTTMKPWTRWWWEGSAVDRANLTWNMQQYRQAGLGGLELTPIYGVHGYESDFIPFLSGEWMDMLGYTLSEAKRLGLGIDLANATGWPFGGPWVADSDASKTIYYKTYSLQGGKKLAEPIRYFQPALVRTANYAHPPIDSIHKPPSVNTNLQDLALDQIQYPGYLPLQVLMAYPEKGPALDITSRVKADGSLDWTAPSGNWTIYALFQGLHGKMVERAAPGGEGYAIDHFSARAAKDYFARFDQAFSGHDLSGLRGFFNDSYEVDDARGQANWTPDFLSEFRRRKGYDLRQELPALFGNDGAEKNSRVRYDYRSVIDELILEHFTEEWKKWAASRGKIVRNQSHGSPANTLDLYAVVDIPETEGNDILRFKFASSAAHVTGKPLVSSESATWLNEHFLSSWGDVKKAIDLYFLGGVNHIFYHGTAYSPREAPWPGWLFYAAVHFQPDNPQWRDFHVLNEYIARVQSFLQRGKPDNDILLYYPIADRYSEPGRVLLQHFDGIQHNFEHTAFDTVSNWLLDHGYGFDFFSDRQLQQFQVKKGMVETGGNRYQVILLPANHFIPLASMKKLMDLVAGGAKLIFYERTPSDVPGFAGYKSGRVEFSKMISRLRFKPGKDGVNRFRTSGKGWFFLGDNMAALMKAGSVRRESLEEVGLSYVRRRSGDTTTYFIANRSDSSFRDWVNLDVDAGGALLFDPLHKKAGIARTETLKNGKIRVMLQLEPYASCLLQAVPQNPGASTYPYYRPLGKPVPITGEWILTFIKGGPTIPDTVHLPNLVSWTDLPGEQVKNFSGTARYSITVPAPSGQAEAWELDLGDVESTADVWWNGHLLGGLIGPEFKLVIPSALIKETNILDILVSNKMANRISYMDRNKIPWKIFYNTNMPARRRENSVHGLFDASKWKPFPSGLLGPVTLTAIKYEQP